MNVEQFEKLKRNGAEVPEELWPHIEGYVERKEQDLNQMLDLLSRNDFESIDRIAHKVKGSGTSYGFESFTVQAQKIQEAVRSKSRSEIEESIRQLGQEIKKVKSLLQS